MERNLTTGSITRNVLAFSLPYLLSYFLQTLYGMADLFIIGQFRGVESTTAVSVGSQVMHMLSVMIVGLALGTTLSQAVSVAVSLLVIVKWNTGISLTKADLRPDRAVMGRLLKIGVPVALQDGFIQISFMVITIIANRRGLTDAVAVGIVEKIIGFLFLVPSSMLSTVSALGAQNIGAGKPERIKPVYRDCILTVLLIGVPMCALLYFFGQPLLGIYIAKDDPAYADWNKQSDAFSRTVTDALAKT